MAKIAFILLTHKDPEGVISQARRLSSEGDFVSIHFDARANRDDYARIQAALSGDPAITFARRRVKCGWGEWSLVEATLEAVKAAVDAFPQATHFYMVSGDCLPIKTAEYVRDFLDAEDVDYIESVDFFTSGWIKTGMREDRLIYRHFFNERQNKWLFYKSHEIQRALGLTRKVPEDLQMMIGSQWWCLRRQTIEAVLEFCRARPAVMRFFKTTWIPDETFFQTLVRHLVPDREIRSRTPTFLMFTDYGMPVTFYNDHYDLLLGQDFLFARKISPDAADLKTRLGELWHDSGRAFSISGEGRALFSFLTGRGRIGRRFAPRFWEVESSLGRERTLFILVCKKWHVAKRLAERVAARANIPRVEYLFNELCPLPALGGIETTLSKRNRHRRALLRMLFDYHCADRLLICVDPTEFDLLRDLTSDRVDARILEIECDFTDDYLIGHARRVGLAGDSSPAGVIERLLPTIRFDLKFESDRMRDAGFPAFEHMRQGASPQANALPIARFLGVDRDLAQEIAATEYLFLD